MEPSLTAEHCLPSNATLTFAQHFADRGLRLPPDSLKQPLLEATHASPAPTLAKLQAYKELVEKQGKHVKRRADIVHLPRVAATRHPLPTCKYRVALLLPAFLWRVGARVLANELEELLGGSLHTSDEAAMQFHMMVGSCKTAPTLN